jgi:GNAT superfamily N-acetyltransferase
VTDTRQPVGIFYTWWRGDHLPALPQPPDLAVTAEAAIDDDSAAVMAPYLDRAQAEILVEQGHRLYLAHVDGAITAFGWAATRRLSIGELGVERELSEGNQYLWGFVTLPEWRGQGLYPILLQTIMRREVARRFWIGHDDGNDASAKGILRAGFTPIGRVYRSGEDDQRLVPCGHAERAAACEALFGIRM